MKDEILFSPDWLKQSMKHYVKELKDCEDYEARIFKRKCATCGEEASSPEYRIFGQEGWNPVYKEQKIKCKNCTDQEELAKVLGRNKINLHKQLVERFEREYWHVPDDLKNAGFKNFKINNNDNVFSAKKVAMNFVKSFNHDNQEKKFNLLIMGNPGTGKTHLATAISRTLKEQGALVAQLTTGQLLSKVRATYSKGVNRTEEDIFNDLRKLDLLVLDDLGSETRSKDEFDWGKSKLFEIVNLMIGKPTIYTSNFNEQHLPTAIGERTFSRLYNNTKFIELITEDYRKNYLIV